MPITPRHISQGQPGAFIMGSFVFFMLASRSYRRTRCGSHKLPGVQPFCKSHKGCTPGSLCEPHRVRLYERLASMKNTKLPMMKAPGCPWEIWRGVIGITPDLVVYDGESPV